MNFKEYKEMIARTPETESLEFDLAVLWLNPSRLPLQLVSLSDEETRVVKIPATAVNAYGKKVPVTAIGKSAFAGMDHITDIVLPSSIRCIGAGAFAGCKSLRRILIPRNVTRIEAGTFKDCHMLEDVFYEGSYEEWKEVQIVNQAHEIEFGDLVPGTPVHKIEAERLLHIPGNDAVLEANVHFHCYLEK